MISKILKKALFIISVLFLPPLILLTSTELVAFDMDYYKAEYKKYDITNKLVIQEKDLMDSTSKLLDYMKDDREDLDFKTMINGQEQEFFSSRDKLHMVDVKNLFIIGRYIRNAIFIFLLLAAFLVVYNKKLRFDGGRFLLNTSIIGMLPVAFLVILINIDFYKYFTIFHEIFFTNDLWLLDPNTDRLVNIFPESFFADVAIKIITYYLIAQLVLFITGIGIKFKKRHTKAI